jgi:hypothetical protein
MCCECDYEEPVRPYQLVMYKSEIRKFPTTVTGTDKKGNDVVVPVEEIGGVSEHFFSWSIFDWKDPMEPKVHSVSTLSLETQHYATVDEAYQARLHYEKKGYTFHSISKILKVTPQITVVELDQPKKK